MKLALLIGLVIVCKLGNCQSTSALSGLYYTLGKDSTNKKVLQLCSNGNFGLTTDYQNLVSNKYDLTEMSPLDLSGTLKFENDSLIILNSLDWQVCLKIIDTLNLQIIESSLPNFHVGEYLRRESSFFESKTNCLSSLNTTGIKWIIVNEKDEQGKSIFKKYTLEYPGGLYFIEYKNIEYLEESIYLK